VRSKGLGFKVQCLWDDIKVFPMARNSGVDQSEFSLASNVAGLRFGDLVMRVKSTSSVGRAISCRSSPTINCSLCNFRPQSV